jgi:hypothetical protein
MIRGHFSKPAVVCKQKYSGNTDLSCSDSAFIPTKYIYFCSIPDKGENLFSLKATLPALCPSQSPVQRVLTVGSVLPEGEQLGREWSYAVTSPHTCMACSGTPLSFYSIFRAFSTEVTKKLSLSSSCLTVCNKPTFQNGCFYFV